MSTKAIKRLFGDFDCSNNQLKTLEGDLKKVGGDFICGDNIGIFEEEEVRAACFVKGNPIP